MELRELIKKYSEILKDLEYSKKTNIFPKRIFGNKSNLIRRSKNLISKEEFKSNRNLPLLIIGEAPQKGNRKFNFNSLDKIIFKPFIRRKIEINLPQIRNNYKNQDAYDEVFLEIYDTEIYEKLKNQ